ncbi:MAG: DUF2130 domain-containing protein [Chloroherpetonaceae bacterium]
MDNYIKCPNCGHQFPVEDAFFSQAEEHIRKEYEMKFAQQSAIFYKQKEAIEKEKDELEKQIENVNELIKEGVEKKLEVERSRIKEETSEDFELKIKQLEEENEKRKAENKELKEKELSLLKKEQELREREENMQLNLEKKMLEQRDEIAREIAKKEQEKTELKFQEYEKKLEEEKSKIKKETSEDFELKIKQLEEENEKRKAENKELKEKELALLRKERELREKEENMQLDLEKKMLEKRDEIAREIIKKEQEKTELKYKEYEKQLEDQKKLIEEMKRKADQGSMQLQGEVQELALADLLKNEFPFDLIDDVPKGVNGADVIQTVINKNQQDCGKIIYESKRTKNFSDSWIEKLKNDQREQGAILAVIVTEALPKDMNSFGRKDGIWICTYNDVKTLTFILREMIIREHSVLSAQENKGDKMELLYNYLVSDDFRQRIEAIVEGFSTLKIEMDREKRAMQKIWKEREKQIEKVIGNTINMYGSIRGIAGNVIAPVKALELAEPDTEEDNEEENHLLF